MEQRLTAMNAGYGDVAVARAAAPAAFVHPVDATWHGFAITAISVMTDSKLRGRRPEEVASH